MTKEKKQNILIILGLIILIGIIGGVTYSFFSYNRTGSANTLSVGNIEFTSSYDSVDITGVFPIAKTAVNTDTDNVMTVNVDIEGHTTYEHGIYYEVTADDVNITVNGKNVPIGIQVTSSNLSNVTLTNYENGKILTDGSLFAKGKILASDNNTDNSVDGTITIKAYLDMSRVAISDTYNGQETDLMGTTNEWVNGRVVLTTAEWNSLANTPLSFKVKVEAYENDVSTLVDGTTFIGKVKKLANPNLDDSYDEWKWWEYDENITTFQRVTTVPDIDEFTSANIISTNDSIYPIYAWYENGVIKYYSESDNIKANSDMSYMFCELEELTSIGDFQYLDTTNVTNMQYLFEDCVALSDISGLSNWNVSNVTNMQYLFDYCEGLTTLTPLSNWNLLNVTNIGGMFLGCTGLTALTSLSNWNVSNVVDMSAMFQSCTGLTSLTGLTNWNVSNVTDMRVMFLGCTSLSNVSAINDWDINGVDASNNRFARMFKSAPVHPTFTKRAGTWDSQGTFTPSA